MEEQEIALFPDDLGNMWSETGVVQITDDSLIEGYLGLNIWNTSAKFNNILVENLDLGE